MISGEGTIITGSGHPSDPYVVTNTGIRDALKVTDTLTVDLALNGAGVQSDPYLLSAVATVRLLHDMIDMGVGQTADPGDTIIVQPDGTWNLGPPPVTPAGAVNTRGGILGDGTFAAPIEVATSGTWGLPPLDSMGADSTIGTAIYVDSAGKLRAAPQQVQTVTWDAVQGKPTTFDTTWGQVTGKPQYFNTTWNQIANVPLTFATTWAQVANKPTTSTLDGRNIYVNDLAPSNAQGTNGDLWFEY
ncbi:MAG: hypothetical protein ABWZ30_05535 [Jiangellaceae bacterium]